MFIRSINNNQCAEDTQINRLMDLIQSFSAMWMEWDFTQSRITDISQRTEYYTRKIRKNRK